MTHQLFLRDHCIYAVVFRLTDSIQHSVREMKFWIDSVVSRRKSMVQVFGQKNSFSLNNCSLICFIIVLLIIIIIIIMFFFFQFLVVGTFADRLDPKERNHTGTRVWSQLTSEYGSHLIYKQWVPIGISSSVLPSVGGESGMSVGRLSETLEDVTEMVLVKVPAAIEVVRGGLKELRGRVRCPMVSVREVHEVIFLFLICLLFGCILFILFILN